MTRKLFLSVLVVGALATTAKAATPKAIPPAQFDRLHAMFKDQPGESRFWDLPWLIQLDEALKQAAAEGKPVLVWCGAGGAPVGVC